jgi:hypothetical protein
MLHNSVQLREHRDSKMSSSDTGGESAALLSILRLRGLEQELIQLY